MCAENDEDTKLDEYDKLRMELLKIDRKYSKIREQFYNTARRYFQQSINSSYIKESDLIDLITECIDLKKEYSEKATKIISLRQNSPKWKFPHFDFKNRGCL